MSFRIVIFLLSVFFAFAGALCGQESSDSPEYRTLYPGGRYSLKVPVFNYIGNSRCDSSGNLFFNISPVFQESGSFLKVNGDGGGHTYYQVPSEIAKSGNIKWSITPDGTLYVLHEDSGNHTLLRPNTDGTSAGSTALDIPASVDLLQFAVANSGYAFVSGSVHVDSVHKKRPGYEAILNPSGRIIRDLSSDSAELEPLAAQHPIDGDVIAGEDGRFYVLTLKDVRVITQSGETQTVLSFKRPDGFYPMRIDYSKGRLSVLFYDVALAAAGRPLEFRALILNIQTGEVQGRYRFADSTSGEVMCYDSHDGYALGAVDSQGAAKEMISVR